MEIGTPAASAPGSGPRRLCENAEMVSQPGRRDNAGRSLLLAGLTALVLLAGSDDVVLPPLWGATVQAADAAPSPDVEDYCRIRRDARTEIRSAAFAATATPAGLLVDGEGNRPLPIPASLRPGPSPVSEHRPHLE